MRTGSHETPRAIQSKTRYFSFSRDCNILGTTKSGSVCIQIPPPTSTMQCMETRLGSRETDAFQHPWDWEYSIAFSPFIRKEDSEKKMDHLIIVTLA